MATVGRLGAGATTEEILAIVERDGAVILEDMIDADAVDHVLA